MLAFAFVALLAAAPPAAGPACPVLGPGCTCGCQLGSPCTCAGPAPLWRRNTDTGDYGLWDGDTFRGGYFVRDGSWHPYQGGKYLAACPCPVPLPAALRPAPAVAYYQPAPTFRPMMGGFGGGCRGGTCH